MRISDWSSDVCSSDLMASDLRLATPRTKTAFLFTRVGLAGCDMGACAILPRLIGQGRASEFLLTGRVMTAEEGETRGFHNLLVPAYSLMDEAALYARSLESGDRQNTRLYSSH